MSGGMLVSGGVLMSGGMLVSGGVLMSIPTPVIVAVYCFYTNIFHLFPFPIKAVALIIFMAATVRYYNMESVFRKETVKRRMR